MAQQTAQSVMAIPGMVHSFVAKTEAAGISGIVAWKLPARDFTWSLKSRDFGLTLPERDFTWTLDDDER